ncbi:MAG TPA: hypothetical protein VJL07_02730 [Dehalococcoidia bacterium]|nr:hypothetical protein [Dehalococcoidia bacterium]
MDRNALIGMLDDLVDRSGQIEVTRGAKSWKLDAPDLPLKVAATVVRARIAALLAETEGT